MRIIVSTFTYPPNVDGVAAAAWQMVENFRNAGHEVLVTTGKGVGKESHFHEDGVAIRRFDITGGPAFGVGFHGETVAYQQFIIESSPDLIVCHCWNTWSSELLYQLLPDLKAKTILVSHGYSAHMLEPAILPRGIGIWLRRLPCVGALPFKMRRFDRVVFLSHKKDWRRYFDVRIARLIGRKNIAFIPNGVSELQKSEHRNFRQRHGIGQGMIFLCIANYSIRKNQERALRAFAQASMPDATLVFIGSELGVYGLRMINLWEQLKEQGKSGQVLFLEGLDRMDAIAALLECDVKVLAADAETQPIVLLEAMAASKPFITTNTGCVEEFRGGFAVRNAGEMAFAMRRLAANPEERRKLGEMGRRDYEEHYSLERTSKAWLELLDDLMKTS